MSAGVPFGVGMGLFLALQSGWTAGVIGLGSGLAFGVAIASFAERQRKRMEVSGGVYEGEPIVHQGPANHWLGAEARGGWLILTSRRLLFRSHGKNLQNIALELSLADVVGVEPSRTLGIVPNGMRVLRRAGGFEKFVVTDRAAWLSALSQAGREGDAVGRAGPPR